MVRVSVLNDALKNMYNAEKRGKRQVMIRPSSKVIIKFLIVMQKHGYIGEFEYVDDHRSGKIMVELNGRLNKCGVISPHFDVGVKEIEGWTARLLPSRQSLCSWDPSKRPTAAEALQHPFFQSCYYVPPSLRPKLTTARTPPFAGTRGALEQQSARKVSGTLSSAKLTSSFPSPKLHASIGVQRKLDMANQDAKKNDKYLKSSANQQKYRPPGKSSPTSVNKARVPRGVSDASEKLSNMTIGSRRHSVGQPLRPPAMKAGAQWFGETGNLYLRPVQEIQPGRSYSRKVAG